MIKIKVFQINTVCGSGSTGKIATDLYDVLLNDGSDSIIAYGRGNAPDNYKTIKIGSKLSIYSHVLKTRLFDAHGLGSKKATFKVIECIKKYNPDIIQLHNLHGYFINYKILFNYLSTVDKPIVWLLHDAWSISGHGAHFQLNEDGSIPSSNLSKSQVHDYPSSLWIDNSKRNFKLKSEYFTKVRNMTIISPSEWLADILKRSFLSKYRIEVINNGIDLNKFKPEDSDFKEQYGLKDKKILLGVANVWNEKKGLKVFEELSNLLSNEYKIVLVGTTDNLKNKINNNIQCINRTEGIKELREIYSAADWFLNPTLEDNFPTTNIEALACGTPVITFNTGGSPESLSEETGIVVEKNSKAMLEAIINKDHKEFTKENCVKQSLKFDKNTVFRKYTDLYREIV